VYAGGVAAFLPPVYVGGVAAFLPPKSRLAKDDIPRHPKKSALCPVALAGAARAQAAPSIERDPHLRAILRRRVPTRKSAVMWCRRARRRGFRLKPESQSRYPLSSIPPCLGHVPVAGARIVSERDMV
jgi:hypothetical protein